jgi:hypothetical protein
MRDQDLLQSPPRLSDLRGDALRQALMQRHEDNHANWRATRVPRGPLARLKERLFG